jgi:alpha-beta hydrolase superfamily lysophospholipase
MKSPASPSSIHTADGLELHLRSWLPPGKLRARVLFIHGMGEHGGRYAPIAGRLNSQAIAAYALDQRGHGHSPGPRGDVLQYRRLLDDLKRYWRCLADEGPEPLFFYGHSMGGQLLINLLTQRAVKARGAIINAPWLALTFRPNPLKVLLAKVLRRVWPGFTLDSGTGVEMVARDREFLNTLPERELMHKRMSARLFHALQTGADTALAAAPNFTTPFLLMHGDADPITSPAASDTFFKNAAATDKTLRIYPGLRHETHNEPERETVLGDALEWLEQRLGT